MDPIIPQSQEQAPMDSTNLPQVPEHKHFLNKKFIVTFVILLLLGGSAYAGICYWQNQQVAKVVPTFTPRADATADWKTYTNTQYGFELKYPNDWRMVEQGTGTFVSFGPVSIPEDTLFGVLNTLKIPSLGIDPTNPNHEIVKIEDASLNGLPAKRIYDRNISVNQISTQLYITHGNTIIAVDQPTLNNLDYPFNHGYNTIINQILSTFKSTSDQTGNKTTQEVAPTFTSRPSATADPIADWKTYTNTEFSYSFKYPSSYNVEEDKIKGEVYLNEFSNWSGQSLVHFYGEKTNVIFDSFIKDKTDKNKTDGRVLSEATPTTINGIFAYEGVHQGITTNWYVVFLSNNSNIVQIDFNSGNKDSLQQNKAALTNIQNQILSTLKFTQ